MDRYPHIQEYKIIPINSHSFLFISAITFCTVRNKSNSGYK
jgi:hypothetical protein